MFLKFNTDRWGNTPVINMANVTTIHFSTDHKSDEPTPQASICFGSYETTTTIKGDDNMQILHDFLDRSDKFTNALIAEVDKIND